MRRMSIDPARCDGCEECLPSCPFSALSLHDGLMTLTENCRYCRKCIPACQHEAIVYHAQAMDDSAKQVYLGILVVAELDEDGRLTRDTLELVQWAMVLGEARQEPLSLVAMGDKIDPRSIAGLPIKDAFFYEEPCYRAGDPQCEGQAVKEVIEAGQYNVVLFSATAQGKAIAPWVAASLQTGLTADCTELRMRRNGDLIQIRPAFGGEIMARIITPSTRPQMVTVRSRLIAPFEQNSQAHAISDVPRVTWCKSPVRSVWQVMDRHHFSHTVHSHALSSPLLPLSQQLASAKVVVVAGRGLKCQADVARVKAFAHAMGAAFGCTRALVELGWCDRAYQIGLSGLAISAECVVTLGVSGSVQFQAGIAQVRRVIAVNTDPDAPIFKRATHTVPMDVYAFLSSAEALSSAEQAFSME